MAIKNAAEKRRAELLKWAAKNEERAKSSILPSPSYESSRDAFRSYMDITLICSVICFLVLCVTIAGYFLRPAADHFTTTSYGEIKMIHPSKID